MDLLLYFVFSVISFLFAYGIRRKFARIYLYIILILWLIPLGISMFNPFGLYEVSLGTYLIVFVGLFSFIIGYAYTIQVKPASERSALIKDINWLARKKWIMVIYLISLMIMMSLAVTQWTILTLQGGMGNLKLDFFELIFNNNSGLYFLYQALLAPLFYISCMVSCFLLIKGNFNKTTIIIFLYVLLFAYVGGKRGYFSILLQYFIIAYVINKWSFLRLYLVRYKLPIVKIGIISAVAFLGAAYMTNMASSGEKDEDSFKQSMVTNMENFIVYKIGPYRALDYALENDYIDKYGGYTYGRSSLGGMLDYYGCGMLNMIGVPIKQARSLAMSPLQENYIYIGENRDWNFSYTSFYYFLFDFGWIGIVIFPFIYGFFVRYSVNLFETTGTIGSLCLVGYMFITCGLFNASWFNVQLYAQPTIIICLLMSYYEIKRRSKLIEFKE